MFHGSTDSVFVMNKKKIKVVLVIECIKPGGQARWLPVLIHGVNYHMATTEDGI